MRGAHLDPVGVQLNIPQAKVQLVCQAEDLVVRLELGIVFLRRQTWRL